MLPYAVAFHRRNAVARRTASTKSKKQPHGGGRAGPFQDRGRSVEGSPVDTPQGCRALDSTFLRERNRCKRAIISIVPWPPHAQSMVRLSTPSTPRSSGYSGRGEEGLAAAAGRLPHRMHTSKLAGGSNGWHTQSHNNGRSAQRGGTRPAEGGQQRKLVGARSGR